MDDSRFFKIIWRVNALLVLCALLLFIGKSIYDEIQSYSRRVDYYSAYNTAIYETDERGIVTEQKWRYGNPDKVDASLFALPLYLVGKTNTDWPTQQLRNFVFVDTSLKNHRWLLPDNQKLVLNYTLLKFKDQDTVLAILYEISENSTNKASIYLSRPNGEAFTPVITGIDRCIDRVVIDKSHLVVFYVKDGVGYSAGIDISSFAVIDNIALPIIE